MLSIPQLPRTSHMQMPHWRRNVRVFGNGGERPYLDTENAVFITLQRLFLRQIPI